MPRDRSASRRLNREILALAVPALGALLAEPLFLLTDTALVGHLGRETARRPRRWPAPSCRRWIGLLMFLAYATTPAVARRLGAGDTPGAGAAGNRRAVAGAGISVVLVAVAGSIGPAVAAPSAPKPRSPSRPIRPTSRISVIGLPAMLVVIAATGLFRGLQDTRTPSVVAGGGFAANALLNVAVHLRAGLGHGRLGDRHRDRPVGDGRVLRRGDRGSRSTRGGRSARAGLARHAASAAQSGGWLFLRTRELRIAAARACSSRAASARAEFAAYQVAMDDLHTIAFGLDSLAIAGQAMIGFGIGARDTERVHGSPDAWSRGGSASARC